MSPGEECSYFSRDWYLQNYAAPNSTSNALANNNEQALRDFAVIGFEPRYSLKYDLGMLKGNELTLGGRYYKDEAKRRSKRGNSGTAREDNAILTSSDYLTTTVYAGWIENRFQITDKLSITPGVRYEHIDQTREDIFKGTAEEEQTYDVWLPSIGLLYQITEPFVAYGNVSRSFAPPSFADSFNPTIQNSSASLGASNSLTYEMGVRGKPVPWLTSDVGIFYTNFEDQVVVSAGTVSNFNTRTFGLETNFEIELLQLANAVKGHGLYTGSHEVTLQFGGTLVDSKIQDGPFDGNEVPYVARAVGTFGVQYDYKDRFSFLVQGRYIGDQFADAANTFEENATGTLGQLNAYTTLDV